MKYIANIGLGFITISFLLLSPVKADAQVKYDPNLGRMQTKRDVDKYNADSKAEDKKKHEEEATKSYNAEQRKISDRDDSIRAARIPKTNSQIIKKFAKTYRTQEMSYDGLAVVSEERGNMQYTPNPIYYGFIDANGTEVIPLIYDQARHFSEGLAVVAKSGRWGYIDKTGKEITQLKYDYANPHYMGFGHIKLNNKYGCVNTKGDEIIPPIYDSVKWFVHDAFEWVSMGKITAFLNGEAIDFDKAGNKISAATSAANSSAAVKPATEIFYDNRGNDWAGFKTYKYVKINTQIWMAENLDAASFRNGDAIPEIKTAEEWLKADKEKKPGWCYYGNDPKNEKYGKIYNWYAMQDPRGLAPSGWHIPKLLEWMTATDYLGTGEIADKKMKDDIGWNPNGIFNGNGTNESGFTGLPGGFRSHDGLFKGMNQIGCWWVSAQPIDDGTIWCLISSPISGLGMNGLSVRCIKD